MFKRRNCGIVVLAIAILAVMCLVAAAISAYGNRSLRVRQAAGDRLTALDKVALAEALHLKRELGASVWPGWGGADIPVLLWTGDHSFLYGHPNPPAGWERVPDDTIDGEPYYRMRSDDHENFAVRIGDRWVASMATKAETDAFLIDQFRRVLPPLLRDVAPYRLLIQPSEVQISGVLHETFHVFQAEQSLERLETAEAAYRHEERYWAVDPAMRDDWRQEIELLAEAVTERSDARAAELVRQFLDLRQQRRAAHNLPPELIDLERQLEWEEGLAKYVELAIWRQASLSTDYMPLPEMALDPDFDGYERFAQRWSQELTQMKRQANTDGVTRFYYTGMAQAVLLDRLMHDWKAQGLAEGIFLEDVLGEASASWQE